MFSENQMTSAPAFDWTDPLLLDESLSEDERIVRDSAHAYCQEKLFPRVLESHRYERFDREIMNDMGALGFLGSTIEGYGCAGVNYVSYGLIAREVELSPATRASRCAAESPPNPAPIMTMHRRADAGAGASPWVTPDRSARSSIAFLSLPTDCTPRRADLDTGRLSPRGDIAITAPQRWRLAVVGARNSGTAPIS